VQAGEDLQDRSAASINSSNCSYEANCAEGFRSRSCLRTVVQLTQQVGLRGL
jgi:hypothetical protein